jgi:hypothetical protein
MPSRTVELRRTGQFLRIIPAIEEVHRRIYGVLHFAEADLQHGVRVAAEADHLCKVVKDTDGYALTYWAGIEPVVIKILEELGYQVNRTGARPKPLPAWADEGLAELEPVDGGMLDLVRQHDRGLIRYDPSQVEPARMIAQVALAWPSLPLVITTTRVAEASEMRRQL